MIWKDIIQERVNDVKKKIELLENEANKNSLTINWKTFEVELKIKIKK